MSDGKAGELTRDALAVARRVWVTCSACPGSSNAICHDPDVCLCPDKLCDLHAAIAAALTEYRNEGIEEAAANFERLRDEAQEVSDEAYHRGDFGEAATFGFQAKDMGIAAGECRALKRTP